MRVPFFFVSVLGSIAGLGALGCGRTGLAGGDVLADGDNVAVAGASSGGASSGGASSGGAHSGSSGGVPSTGGVPSEGPLQLFPETLAEARVSRAYSAVFMAEGGAGEPYRFLRVAGELPPGLALSLDGKLTGTPTQDGEYSFRVRVNDLHGNEAERDYVLVVSRARYLAYSTFQSSTSTRSAEHIVDVTRRPLAPVTLLDDRANGHEFSPDGRWLSFYNYEGSPEIAPVVYLVSTAGDSPGPLLPLLDEGRIDAWYSYIWSPDSSAIAYIKVNGARLDLWTVEVLADGLGERRLRVEDVDKAGLSWPRADTLVYWDKQKRPGFLRFDASGSAKNTLVNAPEFIVRSMAQDQDLAFAVNGAGAFSLLDSGTGETQSLDGFGEWFMAPSFDFLVARNWPIAFGVFAVDGTQPELLLRSGGPVTDLFGPYFAHAAPRFVQTENDRFVVTSVESSLASVHEIEGDYASPAHGMYTPNDTQFVFSDSVALWASTHTGSAPAKARKLANFGGTGMHISPDSSWLLATAGAPQTAHLLPLDESSTVPVRDLSRGFDWAYHYWSADSQAIATLGASDALGRVLEVRRLDDPSTPLKLASCKAIATTPTCPNAAVFQP